MSVSQPFAYAIPCALSRLVPPCRALFIPCLLPRLPPLRRALTTSCPLLRRSPKPPAAPHISSSSTKVENNKNTNTPSPDDPLDFSLLEAAIERTLTNLKADLAKLRGGGRTPEMVEALRVVLVKGSRESVRLAEVAQVVPRGRALVVMVGEKEHLKPILSTLNASPHSLNPTIPSPANPLELHIPLPPPTRDSRAAALDAATKRGETASVSLRDARAVQKKRLRALELGKKVRPDLLKKASEELEKVAEKGGKEVKGLVEGARKGL